MLPTGAFGGLVASVRRIYLMYRPVAKSKSSKLYILKGMRRIMGAALDRAGLVLGIAGRARASLATIVDDLCDLGSQIIDYCGK